MKIFGIEFGRSAADRPPPPRERPPHAASSSHPPMIVRRGGVAGGSRRGFEAGLKDRLTASWSTVDSTVNMSLLKDLRVMRARSREFFRNSEYGRKFANLVKNNVVGHAGFTLKVDCRQPDGKPDPTDSRRIAAAYARWAKAGHFDVTGRMSETMFDQTAAQMVARDGEVLVRLVEGRDRGIHGCQLQLLPGHLLDEEHNRDLADGTKIRMGVEYDAWMKPTAYHLRIIDRNGDMHGTGSQRYTRIPAREIIHLFMVEDADQWRGVPWAYAALRRARQLDQFEEAAMVAANVGASSMGFFKQTDPDAGPPMGVDEADGEAAPAPVQEFSREVTPGGIDVIPDGYEFQSWNPAYPSNTYDPFVKSIARALATGCLVSYHGMTGDLSEVNFSSIRQGELSEREMWKAVQGWFIDALKAPVFTWWLARALATDVDLKSLPYTKFDKFNAAVFFGRRWDWVDPKSDVIAAEKAVALGIRSRAQIIRESGRDPDDVWAELDAEKARGFTVAAQASAPPVQDDEADDAPPKKGK